MRTRTRYERLESAAFRAVGQGALFVAAVAILFQLAKWVA